ncbi:hypothetical protein ACUH90_00930 [Dermabacteraceae bacterium P7054]
MTTPVSRRTIAKGAAWAVPATIVASAAPAMASSVPGVAQPTICNLFFGTGGVNGQRTEIHFGLKPTGTRLKPGQKYTWTVSSSSSTGGMDVPNLNYSQTGRWTLTTNQAAGNPSSSFTVTLTIVAEDVTDTEIGCNLALLWDNSNSANSSSITPQTVVDMTYEANGGEKSGGLKVQMPRRWSRTQGRPMPNTATKFIAKSGNQDKFPSVRYSAWSPSVAQYGSNGSTCAEDWSNNTSTVYPDGSCAFVRISGGQATVPARA